jgi:hypothetical protein
MSDRDLLEAAAKAAGLTDQLEWWEGGFIWRGSNVYAIRRWSPLDHDGDALRLAVRVGVIDLQWAIASAWQVSEDEVSAAAATRRAIVTGAAALAV